MQKDQTYRFRFQDQQGWRKHLQTQGFVVIAQWIPRQDCQKYVQEFWGIMETLADGPLDRNKPQTQVLSKNYPPVLHGGMIQYIGHSRPQWQLRKRAKPLFAKIWNTNNLKSSFDGLCFMNGERNYQKRPINSFLHTDQSPLKKPVWSYQGIQALTDQGDQEGGFVCIPGSHLKHAQFFKDKGLGDFKPNWYKFSQEDKESRDDLQGCLKVNNKAGDFILWDSRTFHCNTIPQTSVLRVCTYICMLPSQRVPEKTQAMRQLAVKNRRVSNHHPGDGFSQFPALPRYLQNVNRFEELLGVVNDCKFDEEIKEMI